MYKVFFNDSSIQFGSEIKKSFKNNIIRLSDYSGLSSVNQFVDDVERTHSSLMFYVHVPNPESVWKHFRGYFTEISAAGGLVRNANNEFLFIKRLGVWDLPKGKIEKKESPEVAAAREVEEECGLTGLNLIKPLDSTFHIYRSPFLPPDSNLVFKETKWFLMNYSGQEKPVPQEEEDIVEVRWVKPDDLKEVMKNTYSSLREFLKNSLPVI